MSAKGLVIAPFAIPPTYLSFPIFEKVEKQLSEMGYPIRALHGPAATREVTQITLSREPGVEFLFYGGHGSEEAICGEDLLCRTITEEDAPKLRDKIIVANPSCFTAAKLGRSVIQAGGKAYLGSTTPMYAAWKEFDHDYNSDWQDYTLTLYRSLLTKTAGEALEDYRRRCRYYKDLYAVHLRDWPNAEWYLYTVKMNSEYFTLLGDPNARLPAPAAAPPVEIGGILVILRALLPGLALLGLSASVLVAAPVAMRAFVGE